MLELKNISYKTEDGKYILKGINLTIDERFVAITGPNGSGKSPSTLHCDRSFFR